MAEHIVVAEDDPASLYVLQRILERAGYEVTCFTNAVKAWDALGAGTRVDLLVTDLHFPNRQPNGVALARHGRQHHDDMPSVFVTAYPDLLREVAESLGPVLLKPVDPPVLLAAVRAARQGREVPAALG